MGRTITILTFITIVCSCSIQYGLHTIRTIEASFETTAKTPQVLRFRSWPARFGGGITRFEQHGQILVFCSSTAYISQLLDRPRSRLLPGTCLGLSSRVGVGNTNTTARRALYTVKVPLCLGPCF